MGVILQQSMAGLRHREHSVPLVFISRRCRTAPDVQRRKERTQYLSRCVALTPHAEWSVCWSSQDGSSSKKSSNSMKRSVSSMVWFMARFYTLEKPQSTGPALRGSRVGFVEIMAEGRKRCLSVESLVSEKQMAQARGFDAAPYTWDSGSIWQHRSKVLSSASQV